MRDNLTVITIALFWAMMLMAAFVIGQELQDARLSHPVCFEDEVIVWDGRTDSHDICVPMDNIVDMGIENAIQNGVLQFTPEFSR